ncbi:cyclic nucleotide-binding domain-containing protein [Paracoccus niistensis]|uniref:Cyclic nucleotide-binding domain-containing protein n=1 Tax=Paracoccus niistensis TaxID=632935 RepID=A0ABV6I8G7_9RHOB
MTPDDLETARGSTVLADLPGTLQDRLLAVAQLQILKPDEVAFLQDDPPEALFIVLEGWIRLCRVGASGAETVIDLLSTGRSFGEASVLQELPHLVTSRAMMRTRLLRLKAAVLRMLVGQEPALARSMLCAVLDHLQQFVLQIEDLKARSGVQRVTSFLLTCMEETTGQREAVLPYGEALLACQLGMKPETLSRAFARLRDHGARVEATTVHAEDCDHLHRLMLDKPASSSMC